MRVIRVISSFLLWALTVIGVLSGVLWAANALGVVQPLVVVSGSMEPEIMTGDLLFATATPVQDVAVGEVASLRSVVTGHLVTHRVIDIVADAEGYAIHMRGDANPAPDGEAYRVGPDERVWQPAFIVPGGGYVVEVLARPGVVIPLLVVLLALIALTALPSGRGAQQPLPRAAEKVEPEPIGGIDPQLSDTHSPFYVLEVHSS